MFRIQISEADFFPSQAVHAFCLYLSRQVIKPSEELMCICKAFLSINKLVCNNDLVLQEKQQTSTIRIIFIFYRRSRVPSVAIG